MAWKTFRNNHIGGVGPSGEEMNLRIVWDTEGTDIAYVVPIGDDDNGNKNAKLIAAAPSLLRACIAVVKAVEASRSDVPTSVLEAALLAGSACMEVAHGR